MSKGQFTTEVALLCDGISPQVSSGIMMAGTNSSAARQSTTPPPVNGIPFLLPSWLSPACLPRALGLDFLKISLKSRKSYISDSKLRLDNLLDLPDFS